MFLRFKWNAEDWLLNKHLGIVKKSASQAPTPQGRAEHYVYCCINYIIDLISSNSIDVLSISVRSLFLLILFNLLFSTIRQFL